MDSYILLYRSPWATSTSADILQSGCNCVRGTGPAYFDRSVCRSLMSLVGHISALPNIVICWFLGSELSLTDGVSTLQLQSPGTRLWHGYALPPLVVNISEMGLKVKTHLFLPDPLITLVLRAYLLTYLLTYCGFSLQFNNACNRLDDVVIDVLSWDNMASHPCYLSRHCASKDHQVGCSCHIVSVPATCFWATGSATTFVCVTVNSTKNLSSTVTVMWQLSL